MISDFQKYKQAKIIVKDLEHINNMLSLTLQGLAYYKKYTPVRDIIRFILEKRVEIAVHLKTHKQILKKRGEIED